MLEIDGLAPVGTFAKTQPRHASYLPADHTRSGYDSHHVSALSGYQPSPRAQRFVCCLERRQHAENNMATNAPKIVPREAETCSVYVSVFPTTPDQPVKWTPMRD
jgi:hypothetical protein